MRPDSAGWHPDPTGRYEFRWHNGQAWTGDVSVGGRHFVDPVAFPDAPPRTGRRPSIAALVIGLCSLAIAWLPLMFAVSILGGIVAAALAGIALRRAGDDASTRALAKGAIAVALAALALSSLGAFLTVEFADELIARTTPPEPGDHRAAVTDCTSDGTVIVVRGTIENLDDDERDYVVTISVTDATGNEVDRSAVRVRDVAAGATADFVASGTAEVVAPLTCDVVEVSGPAPFSP